jgi:putative copper export protein
MMRRALILALMLVAVLVPLAGVGHADVKGDQSKLQAP